MDRPVTSYRVFINNDPTRLVLGFIDHGAAISANEINIRIRSLLIQIAVVETLGDRTVLTSDILNIADDWRVSVADIITTKFLVEFSSRVICTKITSFNI